ncbi:putative NmrA-like domain, reverse transcriptase zinc-binding domain-containing protein [Helianthus anomalus]
MAEKSKILIIGGTGYTGKFIVEASANAGHPTFVLVRESTLSDPSKSSVIDCFKKAGVNIITGDLHDHERLITAIKQVDVVISAVGISQTQLADQVKIVAAIKEAGNIKVQDKWEWIGDSTGEFSVKAVRRLLSLGRARSDRYVYSWCPWVPKKCNIFAWRAELNSIPTSLALRNRNIPIDDVSCPLCHFGDESVDHLFSSCWVASSIWQYISSWCKIPLFFVFSFKDILDMHISVKVSDQWRAAIQGILIISCWSLWRARNDLKFSGKPVSIDKIISEIKALSFLWFSNRSKYKDVSWDRWCKFKFYPSEFGNDADRSHAVGPAKTLFATKAQVRRAIEAENIPYTYIHSNCFAGYLLPTLAQSGVTAPPRDKVVSLGDGNAKAVFNEEHDIATYTIKTVDDPRTVNKSVYINPPGNIYSFNELVSLWEKKIGKTLEKVYLSEDQVLKNIEESPFPDSLIMSISHTVFVKGDQTNFEIEPSFGVEASELYPDVKYTTVDEYLTRFV